jgi:cytochrome c biogenesis protein CcdA
VIHLAFIEGDFAYSLLLGMLAAVNPCGFVLLPTYLIAYLSVADESPTHVRVRRALTVGGSVSLGFLAVFLVVGIISRLFTAWIEMNAKYAALIIGIALIVLGVRMLRGWKPRLWVPALSGNAGSRGVRSMAAFGVVYAVASIGCTLGLLTTAVLGSFARHGVVSGVASVAMYGLGMGVFVTALTVTLAFTKSGLLRASRTVMKVLDRVSSALVIFTGIYLTWYWYTAITQQLDAGGVVNTVGSWQTWVVQRIETAGALRILPVCIAAVGLAALWGLRHKRRTTTS